MQEEDFVSENATMEESKKLSENIDKIYDVITKCNEEIKKITDEEYVSNDYEEIERKIINNNKLNILYQKKEKMEDNLDSPYFGRIQLSSSDDFFDMYIGEKGINDDLGNPIVFDWRAPVASMFYANQTNYKYKEYEYNLLLKRKLIISKSKLKECYEEFNINGTDETTKKITDNFLKSILNSKKRESGFVDIIKSIQDKQNEIIRRNINDNLFVQGVAGSGKTVILLHRLSYLLYNNPDISPTSFCFIAPSKIFEDNLNNLNKKLGIDKIPIYTINEFYLNQLRKFFKKEYYQYSKLKLKLDYIEEDIILFNKNIYDENFFDNIFKKIKSTIISDISNFLNYEETNKNIFDTLKEKVNIIKEENLNIEKQFNELRTSFNNVLEYFKSSIIDANMLKKIDINTFDFNNERMLILKKIDDTYVEIVKYYNSKEKIESQNEIFNMFRDINNIIKNIVGNNNFKKFELTKLNIFDYNSIIEKQILIFEKEKYKLTKEIERLTNLINKKNKTILKLFYKNTIENLEEEKQKKILLEQEYSKNIKNYNTIEHESYELIEKLKLLIKNYELQYEQIEKKLEIFQLNKESIIRLLRTFDIILKTNDKIKYGNNIISNISFVLSNLKIRNIYENKLNLEENINFQLFEQVEELINKKSNNYNKIIYLSDLLKDEYIFNKIMLVFKENLSEIYDDIFQSQRLKRSYAYLVLRLVYELGYYEKNNFKYLFIDEIQDYNDTEIILLKNLQNNVILNLYGDKNQNIFSNVEYRKTWQNTLNKLEIKDGYYELNENYRNTYEIVEYCNKKFNLSMIAIGNKGEQVDIKQLSYEGIINFNYTNYDCVICQDLNILNELKNKDINCLNIKDVKGLEFKNVVVIYSDNYSISESYVSFTRALVHLTILKIAGSDNNGR